MMSNCAFWSASGELTAVHGPEGSDPTASFGPWASAQRLPPGRLVPLSASFPPHPSLEAPGPGWHRCEAPPAGRRPVRARPCDPAAPLAVPAPLLDEASARLLPRTYDHPQFRLSAWPTWISTPRLGAAEGPDGWWAALGPDAKTHRFLLRIVPHQGRLPGDGWRRMVAWAVHEACGLRLVPLTALPSAEALAAAVAWEYRVEAGRGADAAAWDLQVLPARSFWTEAAPGLGPWEATVWLRLLRPGAPGPTDQLSASPLDWPTLLGRLPVADARRLVQNALSTGPGGAAANAALFFDSWVVPGAGEGKALVRHVPVPGLPLSLLSTLFGRRPWAEVDRAKRLIPGDLDRPATRAEALEDLDRRLAEGRLLWSAEALELWQVGYRNPRHAAARAEVDAYRASDRWARLLGGDPRRAEALLRGLDVTDAALCLRDVPDPRWRRFVTARREAELRAEAEFCRVWEARGELTVDRELDAWRSWDALLASLPLAESV